VPANVVAIALVAGIDGHAGIAQDRFRAGSSDRDVPLLAVVLVAVVSTVTLAYRAKLDGDLRNRVMHAGAVVERAGSARDVKPLIPGLALEGIAIRFTAPPGTGPMKTSSMLRTQGSLLTLAEVLPDRTRIVFSASTASIDHAVTDLLLVEILVAVAAFGLATILVLQGTKTALRPLSTVIDTAVRIAHGDHELRLNPSRTDTELGRLAAAFDQMLNALEQAVDDARASETATRHFLADASHELRTPIAALQATVETLLREQPERPERDRLEAAVARESERLGRLVDDLLGLARLEATPRRANVDLAAITTRLIADAQSRAPAAAITLHGEAVTMHGDPDSLERLIRNLIENATAAIQPDGRIDVTLNRENGFAEMIVTDNGPGIPEHQAQHIFERFVRLDPTKPGHGLGLAIARQIAQQHQGDLTCEPTAAGARFRLQIPVDG
jgi:signal transduction histidine kinase